MAPNYEVLGLTTWKISLLHSGIIITVIITGVGGCGGSSRISSSSSSTSSSRYLNRIL